MNPKDKEYLEKDYMKLKTIHRQFIMMTIGILDGEDYYTLVKTTIPTIKRAITMMENKLKSQN